MGPADQHASWGPSASDRHFMCPGAHNLTRQLEEMIAAGQIKVIEADTSAADEGTRAHEIFELGNVTGLPAATFAKPDDPEDMVPAVDEALDVVRQRIEDNGPDATVLLERRLPALPKAPECWGTADVSIITPRKLEILDYKHGKWPVPKSHPQTKIYMVLLRNAVGRRPEGGSVTIIQPRAFHEDGTVRTVHYTNEELDLFEAELVVAVARSKDPDAPRNPGSWCHFCPAAAICDEAKAAAMGAAEALARRGPDFANAMTDEELVGWLDKVDLMETVAKALKTHANARARSGAVLPGWKLLRSRRSRVWNPEWGVREQLILRGLPEDQVEKRTVISPNQADAVARTIDGVTPKDLKTLWFWRDGDLRLVREDVPGDPVIIEPPDRIAELLGAGMSADDFEDL